MIVYSEPGWGLLEAVYQEALYPEMIKNHIILVSGS